MQPSPSLLLRLRFFSLALLAGLTFGCGAKGPAGKLPVDTPVLTYQAPDADEIAGLDEEEDEDEDDADDSEDDASPTDAPPAP